MCDTHEALKHGVLGPAGILHAHHDGGQQVLIDAGRGEEIGRTDLPAIFQHGLRAFRAGDAKPCRQRLPIAENMITNPSHGQIGYDLVALGDLVEGIRVARGNEHVTMAQYYAFGLSGRTGRIKDYGRIAARPQRHVSEPGFREFGIAFECVAAFVRNAFEAPEVAWIIIAQAPRLIVDDVP